MKVCPKCRQSYEDWVDVCADCRSERLVDPKAPAPPAKAAQGAAAEAVQEIEGSTRPILAFHESEVEEILAALDEAGIPCATRPVRVNVGRKAAVERHAVHVPEARFEEAVTKLCEFFALGESPQQTEATCPACGHAVAATDVNCPECDLLLIPDPLPKDHPFRSFLAEIGRKVD